MIWIGKTVRTLAVVVSDCVRRVAGSVHSALPVRKPAPVLAGAVTSQLNVLRALRIPLADTHARLLHGGLLALGGQRERALEEARSARAVFAKARDYHAAPSAVLEGWLEGGVAGRAKCEATLEGLRAQGWVEPMRFISATLPVFHLLRPA